MNSVGKMSYSFTYTLLTGSLFTIKSCYQFNFFAPSTNSNCNIYTQFSGERFIDVNSCKAKFIVSADHSHLDLNANGIALSVNSTPAQVSAVHYKTVVGGLNTLSDIRYSAAHVTARS